MKKLLVFLLAAMMVLTLAACGPEDEKPVEGGTVTADSPAPEPPVTTPGESESEPISESTVPLEDATEPTTEATSEAAVPTEPEVTTASSEATTQATTTAATTTKATTTKSTTTQAKTQPAATTSNKGNDDEDVEDVGHELIENLDEFWASLGVEDSDLTVEP